MDSDISSSMHNSGDSTDTSDIGRWRPASVGDDSGVMYTFHTVAGERVYHMRKDVSKDGLLVVAYSKSISAWRSSSKDSTWMRYLWNMMTSMDFTRRTWVLWDAASLWLRDATRQSGNIAHNDDAQNIDIVSSGAIARFTSLYIQHPSILDGEISASTRVAKILADILSSPELLAYQYVN